jgi:hypothetical protein
MPINWNIGTTQTITWTSLDVLSDVEIQISRNGGTSWSVLVADTPNTGTYSWVVTGPVTAQGLFQVNGLIWTNPMDGSQIDFTNVTALSDPFSILSSGSINYFPVSSVSDGTSVLTYVNASVLISSIQNDFSDSLFNSASKIGKVYVYYQNGRQQKKVRYNSTLVSSISWSTNANDGTWQKTHIKVFDNDGAIHVLNRNSISVSEDLYHSNDAITLNVT